MSNYFDEIAKVWNTKERKNRTFTIYEKMFKYLGKNLEEKKALEIGSGDGLLATLLSKDLKHIDCMDTSLNMIDESLKRINEMKIENISINDENFLKNSNEKYDIIYSLTAFHHIVDVEAELKLLREHIKENGKIIIMEYVKNKNPTHLRCYASRGYPGTLLLRNKKAEFFIKLFTKTIDI